MSVLLAGVRGIAADLLSEFQLRVIASRQSHDPDTRRWAEETRRRSGSLPDSEFIGPEEFARRIKGPRAS